MSVGVELKQLLLDVDCGSPLTLLLLLLLVQLLELLLSMLIGKIRAEDTALLLEVELVIKSALVIVDDEICDGDNVLLLLELMSAMALRIQLLIWLALSVLLALIVESGVGGGEFESIELIMLAIISALLLLLEIVLTMDSLLSLAVKLPPIPDSGVGRSRFSLLSSSALTSFSTSTWPDVNDFPCVVEPSAEFDISDARLDDMHDDVTISLSISLPVAAVTQDADDSELREAELDSHGCVGGNGGGELRGDAPTVDEGTGEGAEEQEADSEDSDGGVDASSERSAAEETEFECELKEYEE